MKTRTQSIFILIALFLQSACTWYENPEPFIPKPKVPKATTTLEASYTIDTPNQLTHAYWNTSDYFVVQEEDITTGLVTDIDGLLNVNNMQNGIPDFNKGNPSNLELRAAYDDQNLYIKVTWNDAKYNTSQGSWLFNGPNDPLKADVTDGWTSQGNDDNLFLSFDMGTSKRDVWKWSLALSEPLGYAIDMYDDGINIVTDVGDKIYERNEMIAGDYRSGPKYEWDGVQQELERGLAGFTILDPGFYLLNKTTFKGDVNLGDQIYQAECAQCHGVTGNGQGEFPADFAFNIPGTMTRISRASYDARVSATTHDGKGYWTPLTQEEKDNLIARIYAFTGVPGYYLDNSTGSFPDVQAVSNTQLAKITSPREGVQYEVLLVRPLLTGSAQDIQFDLSKSMDYVFDIYLTDNDDLNKIGLQTQSLTFLTQ
ncbi:MAG: c-type cytochrome [Cyclobacteriaceae bacterium]|nr:c-type cytochrome [Cyclobacteriaceae bacterium]